ncbi:MAG: hypothetical protein JO299_12210 [Gammaproteobacteria bacterium]|nr:hypothetical protein [Gammaproteobacteria bacterium]
MNISARSKWLMGAAVLIGAWVALAPREPDAVEAASASTMSHATVTHPAVAASAVPIADSLRRLAHRVADQTAAGSLFAAHSWYVAPPPPPAPVVTAPPPPPKPTAPPLPFTFMGSYTPNGSAAVFFLTNGEKVYDVHLGDTIDNTYSVDAFSNGQLTFTYKPLNQQQQLSTGGAP